MILLRQAREKKGLTQAQLSLLSGVPQQTISAIESVSRKNPGIDTLLQIASALGCTVDDLLDKNKKEGEPA